MDALTDVQRASLLRALEALLREIESLNETSADAAAPVDIDESIGRLSRMDAIQRQRMVQANRASLQRRYQRVLPRFHGRLS